MKRFTNSVIGSIFFCFFLFILSLSVSAWANDHRPFKQGEVVIAGPPGDHIGDATVVKYLPYADLTVVQVEEGDEFVKAQNFVEQGHIAGLNYTAKLCFVPNDPYYPYQWNLPELQSEEVWDVSTGEGVIVAVLDTGLMPDGIDGLTCIRNDLAYNVLSPGDYPLDGFGHGTHVSGIIGQTTNNAEGVAGLAYNACIMPVKVISDTGETSFADIAEGTYWAVDHGAKIINLSLGTDASEGIRNIEYMDAALLYAYRRGVTVVCASGNDGFEEHVAYPAIFPTTIAVGATDSDGNVTDYTSRGEGLDLVAPGNDIIQETHIAGYGWGYYPATGTSMATAHVSAVSALLISEKKRLRPRKVLRILSKTAFDLYEPGYDDTSGFGLVQAFDAVSSLEKRRRCWWGKPANYFGGIGYGNHGE
jgi:serine protease